MIAGAVPEKLPASKGTPPVSFMLICCGEESVYGGQAVMGFGGVEG